MTVNSATGALSMTVDGTTVTTTISGAFVQDTVPFTIGARYFGGALVANSNANWLTGSVSDVRLFKNAVLSSSASGTLYNAGLGNGLVLQTLTLSGTSAPPVNTATPAAWATVITGTTTYKLPLYQ